MSSSPSSPPRILLCGDVLGRLVHLFKRVQSVNKSTGPFDALLCVGQFFPDSVDALHELSDFLEGRAMVPIPTYFTGDYGAGALQVLVNALKLPDNQGFKTNGVEVCPKLYWLRGSGKFSLNGLSVAYLSGKHQPGPIGSYSEDDVGALRALSEESAIVDIFLTNEWPYGICNKANTSDAPEGIVDTSGCDPVVAELAGEIKPRYHIAGTKCIFFAREPYLNDNASHATRFIGLAPVGNKDKQKFIHAISPTPASCMSPAEISAKPQNTTLSPYIITESRSSSRETTKRTVTDDSNSINWRYDIPQKRQKQSNVDSEKLCFKFTSTGSCSRADRCNFRHDEESRDQYLRNVCFDFLNKGKCERGPECKFGHSVCKEGNSFTQRREPQDLINSRQRYEKSCWFCLSNENVESHFLITVGDFYYCALAKGPLVDDHVLLIPVEHCPSTLYLAPEADMELEKFKSSLKIYFKSLGKSVVFYEWVSKQTCHANLQAIPIPLSRASDARRAFNLAAKRLEFEFEVLASSTEYSESRNSFRSEAGQLNLFYIELPEGTVLRHFTSDEVKLPIQFGREVIAGMLNLTDRTDWRDCQLSKEDGIIMVERFKKGFKEFDPTQ